MKIFLKCLVQIVIPKKYYINKRMDGQISLASSELNKPLTLLPPPFYSSSFTSLFLPLFILCLFSVFCLIFEAMILS